MTIVMDILPNYGMSFGNLFLTGPRIMYQWI
jgi:hypothetical protein